MAELHLLKPRPVTMAVMRACESMPDSRLVTTIPVGELIQFAEALFAAADVSGVAVVQDQTFRDHTPMDGNQS